VAPKILFAGVLPMKLIGLALGLALTSPLMRAADGDSIDTITKAVYDTISGPADK
jgi:hypothetical protein